MTQLCNLFSKNTQKNSKGTVTNVISNSAKNGLIPQKDYFDKDIANADNTAGYYIISKNDFVYNPRKSTDAPYGPISRYTYDEDGIVSPLYLCFRGNNHVNPEYFERFFKSSVWHRYIYMSGDSGARHDRVSIKDETFFEMPIHMPNNEEQKKIAAFLSLIEQKIECQFALVENLKKYKRGVLRKVFDHISTSCKKSLLGNLCVSISSGKTTHVQDHGQYPLIGSTGPIGYTDIEEFNEELILIARVGANAGAVNYFAGSCGVTDNTLVVRVDKAYSVPEYILYFLEYYDPHRLIFGSGQPLVTGGQLKKIEVPIASKDQQEKVVELFTLLNKYCTCAQQQLDLLICAKKALLQQLFI